MEELSTCGICYEMFDNAEHLPRFLPQCGHTFCSFCIEKMLEKQETRCPLDKINFQLLMNKVDGFPINYIAKELAEGRKGKGICHKHKKDMIFVYFTEKMKICQECLLDEGHFHHGQNLKTLDKIKKESLHAIKQLESILDDICKYDEQIKKLIEERRSSSLNTIKTVFEKIRDVLFVKELELNFEVDCFFDIEKRNSNNVISELKRKLNAKSNDFKHIIENDLLFKETLFEDTQSYIDQFLQEIEKITFQMEIIQNRFQDKCQSFCEFLPYQVELWSQLKFPLIGLPEDLMNIFAQCNEEKSLWKRQDCITCPKTAVHLSTRIKDYKLTIISDKSKPSGDIIDFEGLKQVEDLQIEMKDQITDDYDLKMLNYILKRLENICSSISLKLHPATLSQECHKIFHELLSSFENVEIILENHQRVTGKSSLAPLINKIMGEEKKASFVLNNSWLDVNDLKTNNFQAFDATKITEFTFELKEDQIFDPSICDFFISMPKLKKLEFDFLNTKIEEKNINLLFKNTLHSTETLEYLLLGLYNTKLTDKGMDSFSFHPKNLKILWLDFGCTLITDKALKLISENLSESLENLQSLTLGLKEYVTDEGVCHLFENLSLPNAKIICLWLSFAKITDKSIEKFVENTLLSMKNLEKLTFSLKNTKVTDLSLKKLFVNLKVLQELKLDLESTEITDESVNCLKQTLSTWTSAKHINIKISDKKVSIQKKAEIEDIIKNLLQARKDNLNCKYGKNYCY